MILVKNDGTVISEADFRAANPLTSFPLNLQAQDVEPFGVSIVAPTLQPSPSPFYTVTEGAPSQVEGVWTQTWVTTPIALADAQALVLANVAAARYTAQTQAMTLNGITIAADPRGLVMLKSAIDSLNGSATATVNYKAVSGWVTMNLSQLQAVYDAIMAQIQRSFANEFVHNQAVNALATVDAVSAYDVTTGW